MTEKPEVRLALFIRKIEKHIESRHDITPGDKGAWAKWFDGLEALANISDVVIGDILPEEVDDGKIKISFT